MTLLPLIPHEPPATSRDRQGAGRSRQPATGEFTKTRTRPPRRSRSVGMRNVQCATRGFSLVEAIIATLLVGTLLVAVLHNVGAAKMSQYQSLERTGGYLMAQNLMSEILTQSYEEPNDTPTFGRESGESGGQRDLWDDVDDYTGWSANPPERQDGTAITGTDWTRSVVIDRVNPDNLSLTSATETGAKKITITVKRGDRVIATLTAVRTSGR